MIEQLKESYTVTDLCQAFNVHRSSYKYWVRRSKAINPEKLNEMARVKAIVHESEGSAGARTIADISTAQGFDLSRYRAANLMKRCGLISCQQPKPAYRKAEQEHVEIPNHLNRTFDVSAPDQVWCGDVTYIWTGRR